MRTLRDNEKITQLTLRLKRQTKRDVTPYWNDLKIVRFTESHSSRLDGTNDSGTPRRHFKRRSYIHVCTAEERKKRQNSLVLVLKSQGKNGPMKTM